jgi:hypothetical protein
MSTPSSKRPHTFWPYNRKPNRTTAFWRKFDRTFLVLGANKEREEVGPRIWRTPWAQRSWPTTVATDLPETMRVAADSTELNRADMVELVNRHRGSCEPTGQIPFYEIELLDRVFLALGRLAIFDPDPKVRATAQEAVAEALQARWAILESAGLNDWKPVVSRFARKHLGVGRTDAEWLEAVSTALLGNWVDALGSLAPEGDKTLHHLRREAQSVHRHLMPLWQRKSGPGRMWMLDYRLPSGETLYDLVADSYRMEDEALPWTPDRRDAAAVFGRLKEDEQRIAQSYAINGGSWAEAAISVGLPEKAGQRVMRKLRRLGQQLQQQIAPVGGVS